MRGPDNSINIKTWVRRAKDGPGNTFGSLGTPLDNRETFARKLKGRAGKSRSRIIAGEAFTVTTSETFKQTVGRKIRSLF